MASDDKSAQESGTARRVPQIHLGDEESSKYVTEVIDNCVWRKAVNVDDKIYWATKTPGELGEPVTGAAYKFRHYGDYILLAPKDEDGRNDAEEIRKYACVGLNFNSLLMILLEKMMPE